MVKKIFDYLVSVATLVLAVSAVWMIVNNSIGASGKQQAPPAYVVGDTVPAIDGVDFSEAAKTLLVVMKSDCPYCTASSDFYRRLLTEQRERNAPVKIVFIAPADDSRFDVYLGENQLPTSSVARCTAGQLKIRGTPTLLLVDKKQRVEGKWDGKLPTRTEEDAVVKAVFGKAAN
jgi:hypothetical protein